MANLAQIVNVIAPIFTNKDGLFLQPIYFPIAEYAKQRDLTAIDVWVNSPMYKPAGKRELPYLDTSATYDAKSKTLFLNVLNRSEKLDITARIESVEGKPAASAEVWEMNHPDLKATHTFGSDTKVRPVTRTVTLKLEGGQPVYTFPRHSLTILKLKL
jgi:alpha-N-arabinofuranosidase